MSQSDQEICRWGIMGTAGIARKNWQAIRRSENGILAAVASRKADRAAEWIAENQAEQPFEPAPEAIGGYENLLARDDIDAVYIPLPTGLRKEWVLKAAAAGKHVLCEKPCGIDAAEVAEITAACRDAGVQFMDGVMFMHSERLRSLRAVLDASESVGTIRRIASQFSFLAPDDFFQENIRMHSELEPLGCLGDLGWYNVRFSLWVMNYEMPAKVSGRILSQTGREDSPGSVPTEFSGELFFDSGPSAGFYCSFLTEHQQWANISGTRGYADLRDFVLPFAGDEIGFELTNSEFRVDGCEYNMDQNVRRISVPERSNSHESAQETKLFRNFATLALAGEPDSDWPEMAMKTQQVLDACLESANHDGRLVEVP